MTETPENLIEITKKAYAVIKGHREGVLQSELWKMLEINSRTCSRILKILEEEGKIVREKVRVIPITSLQSTMRESLTRPS